MFLICKRITLLCKNVCFGAVYSLITVEEMALYLVGYAVTSVKFENHLSLTHYMQDCPLHTVRLLKMRQIYLVPKPLEELTVPSAVLLDHCETVLPCWVTVGDAHSDSTVRSAAESLSAKEQRDIPLREFVPSVGKGEM